MSNVVPSRLELGRGSASTRLRQWDRDLEDLSTCRHGIVASTLLYSQLLIIATTHGIVERTTTQDIDPIRAGKQGWKSDQRANNVWGVPFFNQPTPAVLDRFQSVKHDRAYHSGSFIHVLLVVLYLIVDATTQKASFKSLNFRQFKYWILPWFLRDRFRVRHSKLLLVNVIRI